MKNRQIRNRPHGLDLLFPLFLLEKFEIFSEFRSLNLSLSFSMSDMRFSRFSLRASCFSRCDRSIRAALCWKIGSMFAGHVNATKMRFLELAKLEKLKLVLKYEKNASLAQACVNLNIIHPANVSNGLQRGPRKCKIVTYNSTMVIGYKCKGRSVPCAFIQPWLLS